MSRPSFTGRRRQRRTTWLVRAADRLAHALIVGGGIGTVVAVSMVCVFLVWVVVPLIWPGSIEQVAAAPIRWSAARQPWRMAVDEHQVAGWALLEDGTLEVFRLDRGHAGEPLASLRPFGDAPPTAAAFTIEGNGVAVGFADGTVRHGTIGFRTAFLDPDELDSALRLQPGRVIAAQGGLIQRMPGGQFRRQSIAIELGEPVKVAEAAIEQIDLTTRSTGSALCTLSAEGELALHLLRAVRNFETGEQTFKVRTSKLPYRPAADGSKPLRVLLSGVGDTAFVAWPDGRLARYDVRSPAAPELAEEVDLVPEAGATLTSLEFMIGKATLVAGDSLGRVRGWFMVHQPKAKTADGKLLVPAHELPSYGPAVTSLASSARMRMLAAGYGDGAVRVFYLTTDDLLVETAAPAAQDVRLLAISPKDNGIVAATSSSLVRWRLKVPHPEATLRSLFLPVWYEGEPQPQYVWQSSSGEDAFEPKLGLVPLVFGTIKATFYSLLFGVPLALLAAVYTSEFLHPRTRARIKPTIELMASLPSVVLGFLAALVLAPLVEDFVPALITSLATIPLALLLGAYAWQMLPPPTKVAWAGWRMAGICLALPAGAIAATWLAPGVERLLFAGDIKAWLAGGAGSGTGGWMLLLTPAAAAATAWVLAGSVNPALRRMSADWTPARAAAVELIKFVAAVAAALLLAGVASLLLNALDLDPRGSFLGTYKQRNALVVGFVMGFAIIPIIYTIAEDALSSVPEHLRSASLGAGATQWQTARRIVIPTAMSGLFSAVMIGLGRAVGETMIVLMAAGNTPILDWNVFNGFRTLSANIATELPEAVRDSTHYRTLFLAALVLFVLTFLLNTLAESVRQRFRRRAFQL